ncbi:MAG: MaoC family dehydratase N-terminal domain-containing protein [Granulosicoccus sp.]|nr:MaoC family dehydratase N-terminal domain-containing protein [Granulosicoccus sp.]
MSKETNLPTLDQQLLQQWIGRSLGSTDTIHAGVGRQMASLLDQPFDESQSLPALWHWLYFHEAVATCDLAEDGHARRGSFLPPIDLPSRMWAGGSIEFQKPIHFGDMIERHSEISDVQLKNGRSGQLCFVTITHQLTRQNENVLREKQTLVYRESSGYQAIGRKLNQVEAAAPLYELRTPEIMWITPSVAALFRYSALTYNAHRIHYDREYCQRIEQYPGLVFHGPLSATLMATLAQSGWSKPLKSFEFRAVSPVFDTDRFVIRNNRTEDKCALIATTLDDTIIMQAEAKA